MKKIWSKAFTLIEMMIVVSIIWLIYSLSIDSFINSNVRNKYDDSVNNLVSYIKDARSYGMTNFIKYDSWDPWTYRLPKYWYWVSIKWFKSWLMHLRLFYNENSDPLYNTWTDITIRQYPFDEELIYEEPLPSDVKKLERSIYFTSLTWTWSEKEISWYPWDDVDIQMSTWLEEIWATITFNNNWEAYIISSDWKALSNIEIEFNMKSKNNEKYLIKKFVFDRLEKMPKLEVCRKKLDPTVYYKGPCDSWAWRWEPTY